MRGVLLPLALKAQLEGSKLQAIKPELTPIQERLQKAKKIGDNVAAQVETQKMIKLFKENNVNPLKGFVGLIQIPFFISFFIAVSKMGNAGIPGFENGGYGWLSNLSAPDPTYILPLSVPLITYWSILVGEKSNPGAIPPMMKNGMMVLMILGLYFTVSLPAAVFYYLIPSICLQSFQTWLFNNPKFRTAVGLPILQKQVPPTHDQFNHKSVAAVRPMKLTEAYHEAKEAIGKIRA